MRPARRLGIVASPRWLFWHVLTLAAVATCLLLGRWQWERAGSLDGSLQNLGYALQWPLFAVFFAFMWWRMLRLELRGGPAEPAPPDGTDETPAGLPVPAPRPPPVTDDEDPALAAYNRMLAELARRDREG